MKIVNNLVLAGFGIRASKKPPKESLRLSRLYHDGLVEVQSEEQEVVIALGSNIGDKLHNFDEALHQMKNSGIQIRRHGCLYETAPAYVTNQPHFLNSAIRGTTKLGPHKLLQVLKEIERCMGRVGGIRYGPRPIDLDILFYGKQQVCTESLIIPHERIWERPFVMGPLVDLLGEGTENDVAKHWNTFSPNTGGVFGAWQKLGGESLIGDDGMKRVFPVASKLLDWSSRTTVMGILNVTPDSFSDGGQFLTKNSVISQVRLMLSEGADIIDIGAQSTRPMASKLSPEQEMSRLIPLLETVKNMPEMEGKLLSVDTFHPQVALEAVSKGAHLINDVSGGSLDSDMYNTVANLKVPYVMMHMRGDPSTMQTQENVKYNDLCADIASELCTLGRNAEFAGIPAWRMIIDPGIGFSKTTEHNLEILMELRRIRREIGKRSLALSHAPFLIGPSRKRFLGEICDRPDAKERDAATVASVTAGILNGANIVRVHNVGYCRDAVKFCDALLRTKRKPFP